MMLPKVVSVEVFGGLSIGLRSFADCGKNSESMDFPADRDAGFVAIPAFSHASTAGNTVSAGATIEGLLLSGGQSQIADSVVQRVAVDVVDFVRSRVVSVSQQPSNAMRQTSAVVQGKRPIYLTSIDHETPPSELPSVSGVPCGAGPLSSEMASWPLAPEEDAGVWIVVQALADEAEIGQILCSHAGLPKGRLVRVGAAMSTRCSDPNIRSVSL